MDRKLIESYARNVLKTKQHINSFYQFGNSVIIEFSYDEKYQQQDDVSVPLLDLISFVYSSCAKKQRALK